MDGHLILQAKYRADPWLQCCTVQATWLSPFKIIHPREAGLPTWFCWQQWRQWYTSLWPFAIKADQVTQSMCLAHLRGEGATGSGGSRDGREGVLLLEPAQVFQALMLLLDGLLGLAQALQVTLVGLPVAV